MGSKGYIEVENLTEIPIADVKEASRLYLRGSRRRSTAWTHANDASSRSHWYTSYQLIAAIFENSSEPFAFVVLYNEMEILVQVPRFKVLRLIQDLCPCALRPGTSP